MRSLRIMAGALALTALGATAVAQPAGRPGEGRQRMTAQQLEAARTWEAKAVARELGLNGEQTTRVVEAYLAARTHLDEQMRHQRQEARNDDGDDRPGQGRAGRGGRGRGGAFGMDPELIDAERETLAARLDGILGSALGAKAVEPLGSFNPQWDRMVNEIVEFKLDDEQTYKALDPIQAYVESMGAMREQGGDFRSMRDAMVKANDELLTELAGVLDEAQLDAFRQATRWGRGRGGPGIPDALGGRPARAEASDGAKIGDAAPAFSLTDAAGRKVSLADYKGRIVVLQWINPDCPFCRGVTTGGKLKAMCDQLKAIDDDIVLLAINSTHYMEPATGAAYFRSAGIDAPVLADRDGTVGHLYGARTTPHMFVIDAEGVLRYQGAFDDDPQGVKGADATNYAVQAVRQIKTHDTVAPDTTKSWGCSVKYAP